MSRIRTKTGSIPYARYQLQRAILENALENNYTSEEYESAVKFFDGCAFCGTRDVKRMDHLVPVKKHGDFIRNNVVPACQKCDDSKGQKDYHEWMRNSNSPGSLKSRGLNQEKIEQRIKLIQKWQAGYEAKTEQQLFGKYYERYMDILKKMDALCDEARQLVSDLRAEKSGLSSTEPRMNNRQQSGITADSIRRFVIEKHIKPARFHGDDEVIIRSGDIHASMHLHQQHANVCQTLKGEKLLVLAEIKLLSVTGPKAGGNTFFKYKL